MSRISDRRLFLTSLVLSAAVHATFLLGAFGYHVKNKYDAIRDRIIPINVRYIDYDYFKGGESISPEYVEQRALEAGVEYSRKSPEEHQEVLSGLVQDTSKIVNPGSVDEIVSFLGFSDNIYTPRFRSPEVNPDYIIIAANDDYSSIAIVERATDFTRDTLGEYSYDFNPSTARPYNIIRLNNKKIKGYVWHSEDGLQCLVYPWDKEGYKASNRDYGEVYIGMYLDEEGDLAASVFRKNASPDIVLGYERFQMIRNNPLFRQLYYNASIKMIDKVAQLIQNATE